MNKATTQGRQRKMPSYSNNDHKRVFPTFLFWIRNYEVISLTHYSC